jgi:hypothetical protein
MRYTVQYQVTIGHWVVLDTQSFTMLGSYQTQEDALIAATRIEEQARLRRVGIQAVAQHA